MKKLLLFDIDEVGAFEALHEPVVLKVGAILEWMADQIVSPF